MGRREEKSVEEGKAEMEGRMKKAMRELEEVQREERRGRVGWWDEEAKEKKREVRAELRKWRAKEEGRKEYREKKREYEKLCERKRREETKKWMREAEKVKREGNVWEIVNRGRKKRRGIEERIEEEEWKEYFMRLLGGVEHRIRDGEEKGRDDEEKVISGEEIEEAVRKIKEGKAVGIDGVPGEGWKYGGKEVRDWIEEFCNRVWKGEGWPEDWKEGIIAPIVKKGVGKTVEEYRGVTLMPTLYKIYAGVLAERIKEQCEEKGRFRRIKQGSGRGWIR